MRAVALGLVLLTGCIFTSKADAGLCQRIRCANEIHKPYFACRECGNCEKHCISNFFHGPNK